MWLLLLLSLDVVGALWLAALPVCMQVFASAFCKCNCSTKERTHRRFIRGKCSFEAAWWHSGLGVRLAITG